MTPSARSLCGEQEKQNRLARVRLHKEMESWPEDRWRAEWQALKESKPGNPAVIAATIGEQMKGEPLSLMEIQHLLKLGLYAEEEVLVEDE